MSSPRRRALPDNLDPLVDTLSNVVGILVIVIAVVRLEVGDAVARVARGGAQPTPAGAEIAAEAERTEPVSPMPETDSSESEPRSERAIEARRAALQERGVHDLARAAKILEQTLAEHAREEKTVDDEGRGALAAAAAGARLSPRARAALEAKVTLARESLALARRSRANRKAYAGTLATVPAKLVARLPDPEILSGREHWILVRYGRVYPVDRDALFERGKQAVRRILPDGGSRVVRPDELESVARYLRKADVGLGPFHWHLETEPALRMVLGWRTKDGGIERSRLEGDPALRDWLARRDASLDIVRFHVWSDSFETYLAARTVVEAAGFRVGWRGHDAKRELDLGLRFGVEDPDVRPLQVD